MLEKTFRANVLKKLRELPQSLWVTISGGPYQQPGLPDIIGVLDGLAVYIELKQPGKFLDAENGLTTQQRRFLYAAQRAGAVTIVASSWALIEHSLRKVFPDEMFAVWEREGL